MPKKTRKLTRTQRRKLLFSSDGPDKIDFEYRRLGNNRYSASPRRRDDKKLFDSLSANQQEAYTLIELGWHYARFGIPTPCMRFTDARGGVDSSLTEKQEGIRKNYLLWRKDITERFPGPAYAVMAYLEGSSIRRIEAALRISRYVGADYIAKGLSEYCLLTGMRDQRPPLLAYWGVSRDVQQFVAN